MIPVPNPIDEPEDFNKKCREKGAEWLVANPDKTRPTDLWSVFKPDLAQGFSDRCAVAAMWIPDGTVDHFVSCHEDMLLAYEWSNYRYMAGWLNSSKSKKKAADLLDPFHVGEGWFEIVLPSLQLVLTDKVPPAFRKRAESTLADLPIRDDERLLRTRREWLRMYEDGELSLEGLRKKAPLIANAVEKRNVELRPVVVPSHAQIKAAYERACGIGLEAVRELTRREGRRNADGGRQRMTIWTAESDSDAVAALIALELATPMGGDFYELSIGVVEASVDIAFQGARQAAVSLSDALGVSFHAGDR
ncbi:hypothetical protein [Pseudomonas sp. Q11]|uniref:hypothetical protein n=1 Tax=Pseudomonas sp. Q11 TaxID=2968470 RepID=UPI00210A0C2A|nr:hypothetical protein [Pseudomonas sp. Q11]MCQ6257502.1 hypothetical protein [Pseudomonas sp. Q11]